MWLFSWLSDPLIPVSLLSLLPLAFDLATIPRVEFQLAVFFVVTASVAVIATPAAVAAFVLPRVGSSGLEPSERGYKMIIVRNFI